jgi:hypothetical protein
MDSDTQILRPLTLVVPSKGANTLTYAEPGTLVLSGAKLYICVTTGAFELVTSA